MRLFLFLCLGTLAQAVFATQLLHWSVNCTDGKGSGLAEAIDVTRSEGSAPGGPVWHSLRFHHHVEGQLPQTDIELRPYIREELPQLEQPHVLKDHNAKVLSQRFINDDGEVIGHLFLYTHNNFAIVDIRIPDGYTTNGPKLGLSCKWRMGPKGLP